MLGSTSMLDAAKIVNEPHATGGSPRGLAGRASLVAAALAFGLVIAVAASARADPYADAFARAAGHEHSNDCGAALGALAPLAVDYPQDFALHLRLGWLHHQCEQWDDAARHYRMAVDLSGGAEEARRGLAWALLEQGSGDEAHVLFTELARAAPQDEALQIGVSRSEPIPAVVARAHLAATAHLYAGGADEGTAVGLKAGLGLLLAGHLTLDATYRYTQFFSAVSTAGRMGGASGRAPADHEVHAALGGRFADLEVTGHYAFLRRGDRTVSSLHVIGGRANWLIAPESWGAVGVEGSARLRDGVSGGRTAAWWWTPIGNHFAIEPGGSLQFGETGLLGTGFLSLELRGELGKLRTGFKIGPEERPVYLNQPAIYDLDEPISWGLWASAEMAFSNGWYLAFAYELNHLDPPPTGGAESFMNLFTVTFDRHF